MKMYQVEVFENCEFGVARVSLNEALDMINFGDPRTERGKKVGVWPDIIRPMLRQDVDQAFYASTQGQSLKVAAEEFHRDTVFSEEAQGSMCDTEYKAAQVRVMRDTNEFYMFEWPQMYENAIEAWAETDEAAQLTFTAITKIYNPSR